MSVAAAVAFLTAPWISDFPTRPLFTGAIATMKKPTPLGFRSMASAPLDGRAVLLAYKPQVFDFRRSIEIDVMLARRCVLTGTDGWIPLAVDPDDKAACSLGMIEQPVGWLPMAVLE